VSSRGWAGAALLAPGVLAYAGVIGAAERHAHHAVQLMVASTALVVVDDDGGTHVGTGVAVPADTGHAITVGADPAVAVFLDTEVVLGSAVQRRIGKSWSDDALLEGIDPADEDPRAAVAALTRVLTKELHRPPGRPRHPSVVAALEVLPALIGEGPVRTGMLAARLGISAHRLTHLFTAQVGLPLRRYVLWLRIMTAIARVADGDDLTAAAHAARFADSAHLTRTCRATFGVAPSALSRTIAVRIEPGIQPNCSIGVGGSAANLGPC
jgi:AraC-like DNA-binding protein